MELETVWTGDLWRRFQPPKDTPQPEMKKVEVLRMRIMACLKERPMNRHDLQISTGASYSAIATVLDRMIRKGFVENAGFSYQASKGCRCTAYQRKESK